MPTVFKYVAKTKQGVAKKGEITANSQDEARTQLMGQGLTISELKEKGKGGFTLNISLGARVSGKDVVIFTRQFATMINSGLPLVQCLDILATQTENKFFGKSIGEIKVSVEGGNTLAESLKRHPKCFDDLYCNMVHAGELGGLLDTILNRLAKHIEKAEKLKGQIKKAMIYPSTIVFAAAIVITVLLVFVIPVFAKMFAEMSGGKTGLPWPTQFVIDISNFMQSYIIFILLAAFGCGYGLKKYYATTKGRLQIDAFMLKLPLFGDLIRKAAVAKFTRTMGTLLASGVSILEGLSITAKTAGNKVVEGAILEAKQSISEGKTVAEPLAKSGVFPNMVTHMISVGEATGALDAMLGKIADFYDDEVDAAVEALTAAMEPMIMILLGPIIGFIIVAMYLPIFKMAGAVGGG